MTRWSPRTRRRPRTRTSSCWPTPPSNPAEYYQFCGNFKFPIISRAHTCTEKLETDCGNADEVLEGRGLSSPASTLAARGTRFEWFCCRRSILARQRTHLRRRMSLRENCGTSFSSSDFEMRIFAQKSL